VYVLSETLKNKCTNFSKKLKIISLLLHLVYLLTSIAVPLMSDRTSLLTNANTAFSMTPKKVILTLWHRSYICNAHCDADDAKCQVLPTATYGQCCEWVYQGFGTSRPRCTYALWPVSCNFSVLQITLCV